MWGNAENAESMKMPWLFIAPDNLEKDEFSHSPIAHNIILISHIRHITHMSRFARQFLSFTAALGLLLYALHRGFGPALVHPRTGAIFGYLALLTLLTYRFTARLVARDETHFAGAYFGGVVVRMLLSLSLVTAHLAQGGAREGRGTMTFLGAFFVLYFSWAGFEIWAILSNLRPFSGKQVTER